MVVVAHVLARGAGGRSKPVAQEALLATEITPDRSASTWTRVHGVDVARSLAIVGMIAVHVGPTDETGPLGRLYAAPLGRASLLFVLVAGVALSLLDRAPRMTRRTVRHKLVWRAALLLPAGLALQELNHGVNVILQEYAVLFLVALLILPLASRWLVALAATGALVGPLAILSTRHVPTGSSGRDPVAITDRVSDIVHGLFISGPYPVVTWVVPLIFGMWLGRLDLRTSEVQRRLLGWGASVAFVCFLAARGAIAAAGPPTGQGDPRWLLTSAAHSQMPLWLVGGTAAATAILGGALLACAHLRRSAWPLVAAGQMALTVYVGHLLLLHLGPQLWRSDELGAATASTLTMSFLAATFAVSWRKLTTRGPLELLVQPPWLRRPA